VSPSFCTNSSSSSGIKYCLWANTFSNSHTSIGENVVRCFFFRGRSVLGSDRAVSSLSRPLSTSVLGLSESTLGEWSGFCRIWSFELWQTETEEFRAISYGKQILNSILPILYYRLVKLTVFLIINLSATKFLIFN